MGSGTGKKAEGMKDKAVGKVREATGRAQGSSFDVAEGKRQQNRGKGKQVVGTLKNTGRKIRRAVKD